MSWRPATSMTSVVFGGGIVPDEDIATLSERGVAAIFTPGASMDAITDWLEQALDERESRRRSDSR